MPDTSVIPFAFYGTLMGAGAYGRALQGLGRFEGPVLLSADMFSVNDSYPALMHGDGLITGCLWRPYEGAVELATQRLDNIEGYNVDAPGRSLYIRELTMLTKPKCRAWTYFWNGQNPPGPRITSGNWRRYRQAIYEQRWVTA